MTSLLKGQIQIMGTLADFLTGIEHCIYGGTHINTPSSVTRLGDLMDFGPLFKAFGNNNLPKSPTLLGNFLSKSIMFIVKSVLGNFYRHLAIFICSH